jgi:hypothetical protein
MMPICLQIGTFPTNTVHMKNYIVFLVVFTIVFVSRLPFLDVGYGNEQDGWRVASAARYIGTTGEYRASRLPGFPIVEFVCSLVRIQGPWAMNLLTALASAIAVGTLALIVKHYRCKDFILLALTFAFTPIVFINSTITMDYLWAMMFVMFSWYAGLKVRPITAGLFLGLAAGCRITTAVMLIPFALLFFEKQDLKSSFYKIVKFWIATGIGIIIAYLPVFLNYGIRFITDYKRDSIPSFIVIAKFVTIDVWGVIGSIAIASILMLTLINSRKNFDPSIPTALSHENVRVWIAVLTLFIVEFALHPMKGAYLIPAIPFFLLFSARYLRRNQFLIMCAAIILSSFFVGIDSADRQWSPSPSQMSMVIHSGERSITIDFLRGPIWNDHSKRIQRVNFVRRIIAVGDTITEKSVIVAGSWLPYIIQATPGALPESELQDYTLCRRNVQYIDMMNNDLLNRFQKEGLKMYYLTSVEDYNRKVFGIDLKKEGAAELMPAKL